MKILVIGSEGFIGSHLAERLVELGHKVKCVVLYNSYNDYGWLDHLDKKILKTLGWKAKIPLESGLLQTFNWYLNNKIFFSSVSKKLYINRFGLKK